MTSRAGMKRPASWLAAICLASITIQGSQGARGSPGSQGARGSPATPAPAAPAPRGQGAVPPPATRGGRGVPATAPVSQAVQRLGRDIDALLAQPAIDRATWGVVVRSLTRNETLYTVNANKLFVPASNMKLVTLAAAGERLGWDYSFDTRLVATGPINDGILEGDLVVVGSGDPTIDDWDGAAGRLFRGWAETLKAKGITRINGRIIGDDDTFDDEPWGSGWAWDDLDRSFATGIGALQFNQNTAQIKLTPALHSGEAAAIALEPAGSGLLIRNLVETVAPNTTPPLLTVRRRLDTPLLEVRGSILLGTTTVVRNVAVHNPTIYFVTHLRETLMSSGIEVVGDPVDIDEIEDPPSRARGSVLLNHRSPTLAVLAVTMMKLSQNLYGETLLKAIGTLKTIGSSESGRAGVMAVLQDWGIGASDVRVVDGSGLSPYDLATPGAFVALLTRVAGDARHRQSYQAALPVAGRDGTLAQRFKGTRAENNVRAKTGSLANARSISGYLQAADGEPLVFSILVNNFGTTQESVENTMDAIIVRLASFTRR